MNSRHPLCVILTLSLLSGCTTRPAPQQNASVSPEPLLAFAADPTSAPTSQPATLQSGVYDWNAIPVQTTKVGQKRQFFTAPTGTLDQLEVHVTTLNPGEQAHAPHRHPHEEMMFLREGTLQAMVNDKFIPMPTGSVLFVAPN